MSKNYKFTVCQLYDGEQAKTNQDSKPDRREGETIAEYLYRCRQAQTNQGSKPDRMERGYIY